MDFSVRSKPEFPHVLLGRSLAGWFVLALLAGSGSSWAPPLQATEDGVYHIDTQADFDRYRQSDFAPGSKILFAKGAIFHGQFAPRGRGTEEAPILVTAYDPVDGTVFREPLNDKPILNGHGEVNATFFLQNGEYWEINNLEITNTDGSPEDQGDLRGIHILIDGRFFPGFGETVGVARGITVRNCYIHSVNGDVGGKERGGIHVHAAGNEPRKYRDLLIENNVIRDVGGVGIGNQQLNSSFRSITSDDYLPWQNLVIRNNRVERSGRNAVIFRISENPVVEYNTLAYSSRFSTGHSVFNFNTTGAVMQYNEAYGNTGNLTQDNDRGGFDADWNSRGTVIQYNYSHDNHWFAGIMKRGINEDITIRYNISENERVGSYFYGFPGDDDVRDVRVYNNTHFFREGLNANIFANPAPHNRTPIHTSFWNNIFHFEDSGGWGIEPDPDTTEFDSNLFFNVPPRGTNAITVNPRLVSPGTGGADVDMTDPDRLAGYRLQADSPAIGRGREVDNHGGLDFWGNPLYHGSPDIGAHENPDVDPDAPSPPLYPGISMPPGFSFGSDPERDSGGALKRSGRDWSIEPQSLRLSRESGSWENALAVAAVSNLGNGRNFALRSTLTLTRLDFPDGVSFPRMGFVLLGEDIEGDEGFYSATWHPFVHLNGGELRIREGFNGSVVESTDVADAENPPAFPSESDTEAGIGVTYTFELRGIYEPDGSLRFEFTLSDGDGGEATLTTTVANPRVNGNRFGIGGRLAGGEEPVLDFHTFDAIPPFELWRNDHFTSEQLDDPAISGPEATPAGDGIANILKYAFGFAPLKPVGPSDLPRPEIDGDVLRLTYPERIDAYDLTCIPETSVNLADWSADPVREVRRVTDGNFEQITIETPFKDEDEDSNFRRFLRIRITTATP